MSRHSPWPVFISQCPSYALNSMSQALTSVPRPGLALLIRDAHSTCFSFRQPALSRFSPGNVTARARNYSKFVTRSQSLDRDSKLDFAEMTSSKLSKDANLKIFESVEELQWSLADHIAKLSADSIKDRGAFSVVLSGGSLISALGKLHEPKHHDSIDWAKWHVLWADERVVPKDDKESNYRLAREGLLSKVSIPIGHVYAVNDALSAAAAAEDYECCLKQLVKTKMVDVSEDGFPRFDLILLGMGPDGHIASLFPNHPLVKETEKWITHILDSPKPPPERITMTFPVINAAANIIFVATGSGKGDMMKRVFGEKLPAGELPAQMVFPSNGSVIWYADKAAAATL